MSTNEHTQKTALQTAQMPNLSIVIVSWNVRELLRANLTRLFSVRCKYRFEVLVVDNGSHDGTAFMVRTQFPQVKLITNDWDAGFAGPNNQALRLAQGEVCLLLNPDMLVEEGALDVTYETLVQDKTIGVLGIKLLGQNGMPISNVRHYPDVWSQLAILLKVQHFAPSIVKHYMASDFDYTKSQDVDQVRGSFFAFRRELLQTVGYLDARYHIWFEEVDYCKQVRNAGLRIRYCAEATARDYVGKGMSQMRRLETQLIFTKSMIQYFKKWHPWWQATLLQLFRPVGVAAAVAADAWNDACDALL